LEIENLFTYHAPNPYQVHQMEQIRSAAKLLATMIMENSPMCADQSASIRLLREAVMTANAAIVLDGRGL
jgi:hypothetical protein